MVHFRPKGTLASGGRLVLSGHLIVQLRSCRFKGFGDLQELGLRLTVEKLVGKATRLLGARPYLGGSRVRHADSLTTTNLR